MFRTANSSTDMDSFPLPSTVHVNPATEQEEDEDGKPDEETPGKEEDDALQPDYTKMVLGNGAIEEEPEESVSASTLLVRQLGIIKEPLDAAMAELAASIDCLDTADTPRDGGGGGGDGGEGGGGGGEGVEKAGGRQPGPMSMMPTSDFEEEWRSESEDGEGSDQILQVAALPPHYYAFPFPRSLSPLKVSSPS